MKLLLTVAAIAFATSAHAQSQTVCQRIGAQVNCQTYNGGAAPVMSFAQPTGNGGYQVQTYGQPTPSPRFGGGVDWSAARSGMAPLGNSIDALRPH